MYSNFYHWLVVHYLPLSLVKRSLSTVRIAAFGVALIVVALGCCVSTASAAEVIAGWDRFPFNPDDQGMRPPTVDDGITTGDFNFDGGFNVDPQFEEGNDDGTWGTLDNPMAELSKVGSSSGARLVNGNSGFIDFVVTDTGGADRDLTGFHFDSATFRPNSAREFELSVVSGDLTVGSVATGNVPSANGGMFDWSDFDIDLSVLADHTLDANGTVTFRLEFTGGVPGSGGHHQQLDNVAISTGPFDFSTPGDFDGDDDVDGADFLEWQRTDGTPSGLMDWQGNYGPPALAASSVPEPNTLVLIGLAVSAATACSRRRS